MRGICSLLVLVLACVAPAMAFVAPAAPLYSAAAASRSAGTTMGPAKDGPFTPIVLAAKVVLGEPTLLKVRGKAIAYHSQYINQFCAECERPASRALTPTALAWAVCTTLFPLALVPHFTC